MSSRVVPLLLDRAEVTEETQVTETGGNSSSTDVCAQEQSLFFSKLDGDARALIFKEILGSRHVHVAYHKLYCSWRHYVCLCAKPVVHKHYEDIDCFQTKISGISLLRTCRRMHEEGSWALYTTNTLGFNNPIALFYFSCKLKQPRMEMLRRIDICVEIEFDWYRWNDTWNLIAETPNLTYARVRAARRRMLYGLGDLDPDNRRRVECLRWAEPLLKWKGTAQVDLGLDFFSRDEELGGLMKVLERGGVRDKFNIFWYKEFRSPVKTGPNGVPIEGEDGSRGWLKVEE